MEPGEFAQLVHEGKSARESLGSATWRIQESERESRRLRRSLYVVQNVKAGELVSHMNVRAIRPGDGAPPKILQNILGKKFRKDEALGTPFSDSLIED
jgi:N-acetylneuraminate synthase